MVQEKKGLFESLKDFTNECEIYTFRKPLVKICVFQI